MKAIILSDADVELLLAMVDRNPRHGTQGGSSAVLSDTEERAHAAAHRFYNYQVREWLSKVGAK